MHNMCELILSERHHIVHDIHVCEYEHLNDSEWDLGSNAFRLHFLFSFMFGVILFYQICFLGWFWVVEFSINLVFEWAWNCCNAVGRDRDKKSHRQQKISFVYSFLFLFGVFWALSKKEIPLSFSFILVQMFFFSFYLKSNFLFQGNQWYLWLLLHFQASDCWIFIAVQLYIVFPVEIQDERTHPSLSLRKIKYWNGCLTIAFTIPVQFISPILLVCISFHLSISDSSLKSKGAFFFVHLNEVALYDIIYDVLNA